MNAGSGVSSVESPPWTTSHPGRAAREATIDGDVRNQFVEATLGFDTATKVYAQLVGNMATDGNSAKKYYYYVRLMGCVAV